MFFWKRDPRRRQFFIKKEFQGKFILLYAICVLGPASLAVLALYVQASQEIERLLFSSHLHITDTREIFHGLLLKTNLLSSAFIVVLVMLLSLFFFQRLNKHFYRMQERFEAMGRGDFSLAPQPMSRFNEISNLIELAEQTRQDYHERFEKIEALLLKLEASLAAGAETRELREHAKELDGHLQRISLPESSPTQPD